MYVVIRLHVVPARRPARALTLVFAADAFKMIDVDGNEYIDRFELQLLVDAVYRAMEAVDIKLPDDSKTFADKIILLMADVSGKITLQQYKSCVSKNTLFFQSLGLIFDTGTCACMRVYMFWCTARHTCAHDIARRYLMAFFGGRYGVRVPEDAVKSTKEGTLDHFRSQRLEYGAEHDARNPSIGTLLIARAVAAQYTAN